CGSISTYGIFAWVTHQKCATFQATTATMIAYAIGCSPGQVLPPYSTSTTPSRTTFTAYVVRPTGMVNCWLMASAHATPTPDSTCLPATPTTPIAAPSAPGAPRVTPATTVEAANATPQPSRPAGRCRTRRRIRPDRVAVWVTLIPRSLRAPSPD